MWTVAFSVQPRGHSHRSSVSTGVGFESDSALESDIGVLYSILSWGCPRSEFFEAPEIVESWEIRSDPVSICLPGRLASWPSIPCSADLTISRLRSNVVNGPE